MGVALYLHVPFCASKCSYCDFESATDVAGPLPAEGVNWAVTSRVGEDATLGDAFCATVPLFLEEFVQRGVMNQVPSVYVGGGTPTVLGERLPAMLSAVLEMIGLDDGAEVTVEANPDSLTPELVRSLLDAGATRFSLGIQSFDDDVLRLLGRAHDARQAREGAAILAASGAPFSVDLICGIPGLDDATWRASLEAAVATGAGHISVYPLSLEEGTPLEAQVRIGTLPEPDPDAAADQMLLAQTVLGAAGLVRYEVANYARPGEEARHNTGYWSGVPYLGVGPSAASMMPVPLAMQTPVDHYVGTWPAQWRSRFVFNDTLANFLGYLWDQHPSSLEALTAEESAREDAMLGLRMARGIDDALAGAAAAVPVLEGLEADGLVAHAAGRWQTTERGWLLGNEVFGRVWAGE